MEFSNQSRREYVLSALDKYEQHLTRYAARMVHGNLDLAADAVQFTFMKLCEQQSRRDDSQLKAWLFTVCRNRIIDDVRKNGRWKPVEPEQMDAIHQQSSNPADWLEDQESLDCLKKRIEQLPANEREIIDLWSHGFKHQEIAEIISQKPGTVRVKLHRAIKSLKELFRESESKGSQLLN